MQNSHAVNDYLATIFELTRSDTSVGASAVARRLGVSPAAVTAMIRRLVDRDLVERVPDRRTRLTARGERDASRVLRRRRVLEWFLREGIGYPPERIAEQAERLEHGASDALIHAVVRVWGEPGDGAGLARPVRTRAKELAAGGKRPTRPRQSRFTSTVERDQDA
jgi:DtxR family Mn-dependent transcriptional regulator